MNAWISAAVSLVGLSALAVQVPQAPTVFRATAHGVTVDVAVLSGGKPVTDLRSTDFSLLDNGVQQHLDLAALVETAAVDVTLLIDVSGSTSGAIDGYRDQVRRIAKALRPEDSIRVLTFDTLIHEVVPRQPSGTPPPVNRIATGTMTAANDALAAALLLPVPLGRRHLVFAFTDGYDNSSLIRNDEVVAAASHSDAILYVGVTTTALDMLNFPRSPMAQAAAATGGEAERSDALAADFLRRYQSYRARYLLTYELSGTAPSGWHDLTISINRKGKFTIDARRGYFGTPD